MNRKDSNNTPTVIWGLFLVLPIIVGIVYLKMQVDERESVNLDTETLEDSNMGIAVPDTSFSSDVFPMVEDAFVEVCRDTVETDKRPPMEAGNEDGYWDGWYDGVETGKRSRYDENSRFATLDAQREYAENYREGYERGFEEAIAQRPTEMADKE